MLQFWPFLPDHVTGICEDCSSGFFTPCKYYVFYGLYLQNMEGCTAFWVVLKKNVRIWINTAFATRMNIIITLFWLLKSLNIGPCMIGCYFARVFGRACSVTGPYCSLLDRTCATNHWARARSYCWPAFFWNLSTASCCCFSWTGAITIAYEISLFRLILPLISDTQSSDALVGLW